MQASAETTMATAGTADLYITKLEEMGDYAKLSADDQQEYRNVLTLLCDLIPDLAGYIDTTTGEIQGGTTALRGYAKLDKTNTSGRAQKTGAQATGTRNAEPGWTLVGEYGPEIVYMQGGEGVLNAAQTKDVLPALDDRYTDTRAENAEAPAPKETAQAAESAAVNPHEGIRNDTRAAQTPATAARVMGRCGRDRCAAGFAWHCDRAYDSTEHHLDQAQRQIRHLGRKADGCIGEQPRIPQAAVGT